MGSNIRGTHHLLIWGGHKYLQLVCIHHAYLLGCVSRTIGRFLITFICIRTVFRGVTKYRYAGQENKANKS